MTHDEKDTLIGTLKHQCMVAENAARLAGIELRRLQDLIREYQKAEEATGSGKGEGASRLKQWLETY